MTRVKISYDCSRYFTPVPMNSIFNFNTHLHTFFTRNNLPFPLFSFLFFFFLYSKRVPRNKSHYKYSDFQRLSLSCQVQICLCVCAPVCVKTRPSPRSSEFQLQHETENKGGELSDSELFTTFVNCERKNYAVQISDHTTQKFITVQA